MSDWREMLNRQPAASPAAALGAMPIDEPEPEIADAPDPLQYQPWIAQRGQGRPALFIDFRRFEPKTGLVLGCQMSYPQLISIDYVGETMVSLDFGSRRYVIEGTQLGELTRLLQRGMVLAVQEFSTKIWKEHEVGPIVRKIGRIEKGLAAP